MRPAGHEACKLAFVGKNILQSDLQLYQDRLQFAQSDVVLAALDAVKRGIRNPNLLGKISIREASTRLPQVTR